MTQMYEVYKCEACGNIVEVLHTGPGELVCCEVPMIRMDENTVDAAKEKHVPVIKKIEGGYEVSVGSVPHPMEDKHYIEWIELDIDGKKMKKFLKPGMEPKAVFCVCAKDGCCENPKSVTAREYCNLHGLWKGK
jgi:superoxide reductase